MGVTVQVLRDKGRRHGALRLDPAGPGRGKGLCGWAAGSVPRETPRGSGGDRQHPRSPELPRACFPSPA